MERRREGGIGGGGKEELRVTVNPIFIERETQTTTSAHPAMPCLPDQRVLIEERREGREGMKQDKGAREVQTC